jgi:hydroxyacylglutathione hydrolase
MTSLSPAWTLLAEGIHVRQSSAYWMNSVVLLDSEHTVLIDPGILPSELDDLGRLVHQAEPEAITVIFTHGHWDHVLGMPWWPKARLIAHDRAAAEMRDDTAKIRAEAEALAAQHGERWEKPFTPPRVDEAVSGQRFLKLDSWRFVFRDAPGHCDSQLTVHLPDVNLLIAADMLSDIEIPILNGPPPVYRRTLETLRPLAAGGAFDAIVPGHGGVALGREQALARIDADLGYLDALEREVRAAREAGLTLEAAQEQLSEMSYVGKDSTIYPTVEMHRDNVKFAWDGARAVPSR